MFPLALRSEFRDFINRNDRIRSHACTSLVAGLNTRMQSIHDKGADYA
jgi:hypothetical protein